MKQLNITVITVALILVLYALLQRKTYVVNVYDIYVVISKINIAISILLIFGVRLLFYSFQINEVGLVEKLDFILLLLGTILFLASAHLDFDISNHISIIGLLLITLSLIMFLINVIFSLFKAH